MCNLNFQVGTSLEVQRLGLLTSTAGGMGLILVRELRSPHATQQGQKKKEEEEQQHLSWGRVGWGEPRGILCPRVNDAHATARITEPQLLLASC